MCNFGNMTFLIKYLRFISLGCLLFLIACSENEDRPAETDYKPVARVEKDSVLIISPGKNTDSIAVDDLLKDTSLFQQISQKAAVFTIPDTSLIKDIIIDKGEDEFYSESDRNFFIQDQAAKFLEEKGVKVFFPKKRYIAFKGKGKTYFLDTQLDKNNPWLSVYFSPDTVPVFFDSEKIKTNWEKVQQEASGK